MKTMLSNWLKSLRHRIESFWASIQEEETTRWPTYQDMVEDSEPQNMMRKAFEDIGTALSGAVEKYEN